MSDLTPYEEAAQEAEGNAVATLIETIQDDSLDDAGIVAVMRDTLPKMEDVDDSDILKLYRSSGKSGDAGEEGSGESDAGKTEGTGEGAPWAPQGFNFTNEKGEPLTLTPEILGFLEKAGVNYRALGADHRKSFSDVVRNASRGHLNSRQTDELNRQVETLTKSGNESTESLKNLQAQIDAYDQLLQAAAAGNGQPFVDAVGRYKQALGEAPVERSKVELEAQEIVDKRDAEATYERAMTEYVRPRMEVIAKEYGVEDIKGLEAWAVNQIDTMPGEMSPAQVKFWFENTIYQELDELQAEVGTTASKAITSTPAVETTANATSVTEIANLKNEIEQLKAKGGAPASGGGDEGPGTAKEVSKGIDKMSTQEMWDALKARDY